MRRAIFILDGIVNGLEAKGATFASTSKFTKYLVAQFPEGNIEFRLAEKMKGGSVMCVFLAKITMPDQLNSLTLQKRSLHQCKWNKF